MILKIKATPVFGQIKEFENDYKILLLQGGSRSSKTYSIFQHYILKALQGEQFTLTICRASLTWIKTTLLKDLEAITKEYNIPITPNINPNRAEQNYYINGSEFAFFGLDYAEKLHGRTQDYSWLNEVIELKRKDFDQLEMRTKKQLMIDFNPSDDSHWVFDLEKRDDVKLIKSTMLDNPFLPETIRAKIRSYEPTPHNIKQGTADNYMWEVYGLGNKAKMQGAIFTNFEEIEKLPNNIKLLGYGMDFGFTNDPTTLIAVYEQNDEIILQEQLYQTNMTNQEIGNFLKSMNITKRDDIIADSAEPKSIEEIYRQGFNIKGVTKGSDSINFGIDLMKSKKLLITRDSVNLLNELRKYKWAEDKNGRSLNKPIDSFNHCLDAVRYVFMEKLKSKRKFEFVANY